MTTFKRMIAFLSAGIIGITFAGIVQAQSPGQADETFTASIRIFKAITVTELSALSFPATESSASSQTVSVGTSDSGAATFSINGDPDATISASIAEASLTLNQGSTNIIIDGFTFGGGLTSGNGSGSGTLNSAGALASAAAVGATANIPADATSGLYSGSLTFRVVYVYSSGI